METMKTYTARYDGLSFEFEAPHDATKADIQKIVNEIISDPVKLLDAYKKAMWKMEKKLRQDVEFYKSLHDIYSQRVMEYQEHEMRNLKMDQDFIGKLFNDIIPENKQNKHTL